MTIRDRTNIDLNAPIYTVDHVGKLLHMTRRVTYRLVEADGFPVPRQIGGAYQWERGEIFDWWRAQPRGYRQPRRPVVAVVQVTSTALPPVEPDCETRKPTRRAQRVTA
jgi:predicted DNA-binding transcriptional regulator AlpA